ncbi:hypothetical protein IWQ61_007585 [Dispira simplex]|nr:hypothetical protein IWQ61_007585 [Dispira simplex]
MTTRNIQYITENMSNLFGTQATFVQTAWRVQELEQKRWSKTIQLYIGQSQLEDSDIDDDTFGHAGTSRVTEDRCYLNQLESDCTDLAEEIKQLLDSIQVEIDYSSRTRNLVATLAYPPSDQGTPFHEDYSWSELNTGLATNTGQPTLGISRGYTSFFLWLPKAQGLV